MAGDHPLDARGRALPHPGWPADRQAPGALELVRRFGNSINRENGAERFTSPAAFDAWLLSEHRQLVAATPVEFDRIIELRETLHRLVVANADGTVDAPAWEHLLGLVSATRLGFGLRADGRGATIAPADHGVDGLLGHLGLALATSVADGTWPRLKACRHCHWIVYDPSKNRSARWCSMSACGARHNAREYRRRRRQPE